MKRKRLLHEWHTFSDNLEVLMNILEEAENESKDSEETFYNTHIDVLQHVYLFKKVQTKRHT